MSHLKSFQPNLLSDIFSHVNSPAYFIKQLDGEKLHEDFKLDIRENKHGFKVNAQIPGAQKDDIHVTIDGPMVTIQAEVKQFNENLDGETVVRRECYYGSVSRRFQLSREVDFKDSKAEYKDGIFNLYLPKKTQNVSQQIVVN